MMISSTDHLCHKKNSAFRMNYTKDKKISICCNKE